MKIILLDKIQKLGEIGDIVQVSSGYARNFLIPKKKAMFASDENLKYVESKKAELAAASADEVANAQGKADAVSGAKVEIKDLDFNLSSGNSISLTLSICYLIS